MSPRARELGIAGALLAVPAAILWSIVGSDRTATSVPVAPAARSSSAVSPPVASAEPRAPTAGPAVPDASAAGPADRDGLAAPASVSIRMAVPRPPAARGRAASDDTAN